MSTHEDLHAQIVERWRPVVAASVMNNERIARSIGLNVVDLQAFGVLMDADRPLTAGDLAELTTLPTSTTTRVIDRLEKAGYVRRASDPADRRRVLIEVAANPFGGEDDPYRGITQRLIDVHSRFTADELSVVLRYLTAIAGRD